MKRTKSVIIIIVLLILCGCSKKAEFNMEPPKAKKIKKELTNLGHTRIDEYFWLNDRNNPEVIKYLEDENKYTEGYLTSYKDTEKEIYDEIIGRIKQDDESVPYKLNGYFYYRKFEKGKEYPVYCRKKGDLKAKEEIILNVNDLAKGYKYFAVAGLSVSPNSNLLAYGVDTVSRRNYTIFVKDLTTGKTTKEISANTAGTAYWGNDNKTLIYSVKDETLRPFKVMRHTVGNDYNADIEVYNEKDNTFNTYLSKTKSQKYILIQCKSTMTTEYKYIDADNPTAPAKTVQPRERGLLYDVDHFGEDFYITTNLNALNFKLVKTPVAKSGKTNWKDVLPHRSDVLVEGIEIFKDYLVVNERKNGLNNLHVIKWSDNSDYYIQFDEPVYTVGLTSNYDFDAKTIRYSFESLKTPATETEFNLDTKLKKVLKQMEVLGGYKADDYVTERIYVPSRDGVKIPVSLVYKKGVKKDGTNPLFLYAYGSYGYSTDPSFDITIPSLLDRGFIYAIAHIRGGQEMGRSWYEDGKLLKKMNTFFDFIDCGEFLVKEKYTNHDKIVAAGGSAGGLLIGATVNLSPKTFKAVIAAVPFVDCVTTMLDESIPLTTAEYDEWGNPNIKEYYDYMLKYSPYDNVEKKEYPAMLVTTGLHDSQVQYWEPAKWVAKLRDMKTDKNILLLKTNMNAGHGGASGRLERYKETATEYAFFLSQLGIE